MARPEHRHGLQRPRPRRAGAFVLTENSLYTVEAWKTFLEHLKPGGILTVTRDYGHTAAEKSNELLLHMGIAVFGVAILMNGISALALFYFVSVLGIPAATAGFLVFLSKIYDAVSDPLTGWMSDRTQSTQGRRRPGCSGAPSSRPSRSSACSPCRSRAPAT
ncbi:MAG: MFS transporter [Aquincola sp.]|nr:MFS transporter [Aquincola sp.]